MFGCSGVWPPALLWRKTRHVYEGHCHDRFEIAPASSVACAELLIDAGAVVIPSVCEGILISRARGLLQVFRRKGLVRRRGLAKGCAAVRSVA
jgi:hypothetical protein